MKKYQQNKGYRALVNAALLSGIGMSLFNIVFVVYASTLPFNALAVSLASMALLVPDLLRILTGYLADRTKNKVQWMISSRLLQGVLFVALTFLIQLPPSLWSFFLLLGINIVSDCLGAYCSGLQLPYVRRLVPADALDSAMGFQMACQTTVQIVFQGIGAWGIILLNNNFAAFGLINAVTFFLAAIVIFWNRSLFYAVPGKINQAPTPLFQNFSETFKLLTGTAFLKKMILFALLINTLAASTSGLLNLQLLDDLALWFATYGNTVAMAGIATSIGMVAGALFAADWFKNTGLVRLIAYTAFVLCLLTLNFLFLHNRWLMIALLFAEGYLIGKINPRFSAHLIREIDEEHLAISSGIFSTIVMLGGPVGQMVFLGIGNRYHVAWSWLLYLLFAFLVAIAALVAASTLEKTPTTAAPKIAAERTEDWQETTPVLPEKK